ncbi:MAG: dNTP triphosphohydrolase [Eubacteriales bacterium]|nr:dNTP triphosphohydrolase [Eubacteriales bacterium]
MQLNWSQLLSEERMFARNAGRFCEASSAFEEDYHRIIISASFRRLQDKTQVFTLDKSDYVRTRLTHSLEVSAVGKLLARRVCDLLATSGHAGVPVDDQCHAIREILMAAAFLHDIGNPPFGHSGEYTIRRFFEVALDEKCFAGRPLRDYLNQQMQGDFLHYEGNAQALRLFNKLHFLVEEDGLNLSFGLLATIIKYPVSSLQIDPARSIRRKKMGYFHSENELFSRIVRSCGLADSEVAIDAGEVPRHPLTFLLEAADDIAYNTADTEDAYRKGFISYIGLCRELEAAKSKPPYQAASPAVRLAYDHYCEDLEKQYQLALSTNYCEAEIYAIQNNLLYAQQLMVEDVAAAFVERYLEIMSGSLESPITDGRISGLIISTLFDICERHAFHARAISAMRIACDSILSYLLERFVSAIIPYDSEETLDPLQAGYIDLISRNYLSAYHRQAEGCDPAKRLYLRLMLVCDFICGMTDHYARDLYLHLTGSEIS